MSLILEAEFAWCVVDSRKLGVPMRAKIVIIFCDFYIHTPKKIKNDKIK